MTQRGAVFSGPISLQVDLPAPAAELLPGVQWGAIDAFPSPAYWAYQVLARRMTGQSVRYRLGETLQEEVAACLLGGHGIPANVGVAAFHRLRDRQILNADSSSDAIFMALSEPLTVRGRPVRYRFARQKAQYLSKTLQSMSTMSLAVSSGRELRDLLLDLPGIGYKTASWIARNWLDADDVAILDIHVLRAGRMAGLFPTAMTVERDYLALEQRFLTFSLALGVRASELDAVIWLEMASSSSTVRAIIGTAERKLRSRGRAHISRPNPHQQPLID